MTFKFLALNINDTWMFRDEKVAAINDARISQRRNTTTQTPLDIRTETIGFLNSRRLYQTTMADGLSVQRLKDDGTVTPEV